MQSIQSAEAELEAYRRSPEHKAALAKILAEDEVKHNRQNQKENRSDNRSPDSRWFPRRLLSFLLHQITSPVVRALLRLRTIAFHPRW